MSERKVFIHAERRFLFPGVPEEDLERLADLLRGEGLDAEYGEPIEGREYADPLSAFFETVYIWFAQGAVGAAGGAVTLAAFKWMKDRFLKEKDEGRRIRVVVLVEDHGEEGRPRRTVRLEGASKEPVVRDFKEFEAMTVKKPDDMREL